MQDGPHGTSDFAIFLSEQIIDELKIEIISFYVKEHLEEVNKV